MQIVKYLRSLTRDLARRPRLLFVLVALSYLLVVAYYMTPQILSPTTTVYGFGDNTAGAIWRYEVSPHNPFWGYENSTNYPFGENLRSPVHFSGSIQYVTYWLLSLVLGPVLGYNVLNIAGFLLSALLMFGFIKALTGRPWIAWLAGYAVAFTPYYQMKVGGHPTYGYQAIFIGILWLFMRLIKYRRKLDAVLLGIVFAAAFYFDIYLALFSSIVVASLLVAWLLVNRRVVVPALTSRGKKVSKVFRNQLQRLALSILVMITLIMPLGIFFATQHQTINAEVAAARGNVVAEAKACSNWPHEYLTPFVLNPFLEKVFGKDRYHAAVNSLKNNFTCGIGEDSTGVSITLAFVAMIGLIVLSWERINGRRLHFTSLLSYSPKMLLIGVGVTALLALAIGFPPLKFHNVLPTPSFELLSITTTWRTLARTYMLVNLALVIVAAIVLAYFARHFAKNKKLLVVGYVAILLGIFIEYQAFMPFQGNTLSNYNYAKDTPSAYVWLSGQKDIRVVAEYPLEREGGESDAGSYYLTMQTTHDKKLFNSALSNSPQDAFRTGLKDLSDPQTLPVLRSFGVDAVIVHGVPREKLAKLPGVKVLYAAPQSKFNLLSHTPTIKNDNIVIVDITSVPKAASFVALDQGFVRNTTIIRSVIDWEYEATSPSKLDVFEFSDGKPRKGEELHTVCFSVKMAVPTETDTLLVGVDGQKAVGMGRVTGQYREVRVSAKQSITISSVTKHNMRVTKLGCEQ